MKKYSSTFQWRMAVFHLYGYSTYKDTRSCPSYVDHDIQSERHWPSAGHVTRVRVTKSSARPPENPPKKSRSTSNVTYWRNDIQTWCLQSSKDTHFLWVGGKTKKKKKRQSFTFIAQTQIDPLTLFVLLQLASVQHRTWIYYIHLRVRFLLTYIQLEPRVESYTTFYICIDIYYVQK